MSDLARYRHIIRQVHSDLVPAWDSLDRYIDSIAAKTGGIPSSNSIIEDPSKASQSVAAPPPADFNTEGIDGKFITTINNPQSVQPQSVKVAQNRFSLGINVQKTPLLHNLQSATDLNFNQNSSLKDYGISSQLMWTDQDPNVVRFFRLRSSYDGQNWNAWQVFSSALTCGPVGVNSGLLRTAALAQVNGAATPTTQPLTSTTGVGVNAATVTIAPFVVQYPAPIGPKTYNAGTIVPLLDATTYYVYCLDPTYAGGTQTYIASTSNPEITAADAVVYLGLIITPAHGAGGTGGTGGGNGPCFSGNTLIITKDGLRHFRDVIGLHDEILTMRGWRKVRNTICHLDYDGPMCDMDNDELVTPGHRFWWKHGWVRAEHIFMEAPQIRRFQGPVFNLEIDGDGSDEEQCYVLANGWIAHNQQKR